MSIEGSTTLYLRIKFTGCVALCHWVSVSSCFEGPQCLRVSKVEGSKKSSLCPWKHSTVRVGPSYLSVVLATWLVIAAEYTWKRRQLADHSLNVVRFVWRQKHNFNIWINMWSGVLLKSMNVFSARLCLLQQNEENTISKKLFQATRNLSHLFSWQATFF